MRKNLLMQGANNFFQHLYEIFKFVRYSVLETIRKDTKIMKMILRTTDLCKKFKGQIAVDNVSLHIEENSVYGLLGPNGAGKSTILKMIAGTSFWRRTSVQCIVFLS